MKRLDLIEQPMGQLGAGNHHQGWDVIDRLFRVKLGTLAAGAIENVDDMAFDIEKAELEDCKQSARARANDNRIGGNHLIIHALTPEIRLG